MSIRINAASRMVGDRDNIEQAAQFFVRINIGTKAFSGWGTVRGNGDRSSMAPGDRELIEACVVQNQSILGNNSRTETPCP